MNAVRRDREGLTCNESFILFFFSTSDLNPTRNSGPVVIHASKCEKYGTFP